MKAIEASGIVLNLLHNYLRWRAEYCHLSAPVTRLATTFEDYKNYIKQHGIYGPPFNPTPCAPSPPSSSGWSPCAA